MRALLEVWSLGVSASGCVLRGDLRPLPYYFFLTPLAILPQGTHRRFCVLLMDYLLSLTLFWWLVYKWSSSCSCAAKQKWNRRCVH
uniref:Uncharacterized protein n=1 Tax=Rhipicephalus zambeziensis TaxID=60191 RepID=A0A224YL30_9ACAR